MKVVVVASNSTTTLLVPRRAVRALLNYDAVRAERAMRFLPAAPAIAYAASKLAVSRWVRRRAVTQSWAGAGIRLNALAPGAIMTLLLQQQLDDPRQSRAVRAFPVPIGEFGDPGQLADWMLLLYPRGDDWPSRVGGIGCRVT